jgi:hypothetical protein
MDIFRKTLKKRDKEAGESDFGPESVPAPDMTQAEFSKAKPETDEQKKSKAKRLVEALRKR